MVKAFREWFVAILVGLGVAWLLITYVFQIVHVYGASMEPTFHNDDIVFVEKWTGRLGEYKVGDVVIINDVKVDETTTEALIKRIVGVAGDELWIEDGSLYRNGHIVQEDYAKEAIHGDMPKIKVEEGHVFAMGDNRNHSSDSRYFGQFSLQKIEGKVAFAVYPNVFKHNYTDAGVELPISGK